MQVGERAGLERGAGEDGHGASWWMGRWASGRVETAAGDPCTTAGYRIEPSEGASRAVLGDRIRGTWRVPSSDGLDGERVAPGADVVDAHDRARPRRRRRRARRASPASRSAGGRRMIAPRKYLRETASSSGRPSACRRSSARSTATVCAGVLAKSGPGSSTSCSSATPCCGGERHPLAQERLDVGGDVVVVGGDRAPSLGRRARVHDHERRARARAQVRQRGVAQPADVVEDRRAGVEGGARDRGLPGVDRDDDVVAQRAERSTSGTTRADLLLRSAAGRCR